jgi:hypothetical protein
LVRGSNWGIAQLQPVLGFAALHESTAGTTLKSKAAQQGASALWGPADDLYREAMDAAC